MIGLAPSPAVFPLHPRCTYVPGYTSGFNANPTNAVIAKPNPVPYQQDIGRRALRGDEETEVITAAAPVAAVAAAEPGQGEATPRELDQQDGEEASLVVGACAGEGKKVTPGGCCAGLAPTLGICFPC